MRVARGRGQLADHPSGVCVGQEEIDIEDVAGGKKGDKRPLQPPGTYWEYNAVRINQLSLALLHVFRRPLPEVLMTKCFQGKPA